jgi:16S rRNA (guanine966-N2)-methyltransferase
MRIIGGSLRGRHLVDWEETAIRPVRDFVRTALFNILADFVEGADCLDLFAGTGALGFEALSRGARSCLFVDWAAEACAIIRRNAEALDLLDACEVYQGDVVEAIDHFARRGRQFDVVFVDPPYFEGAAPRAVEGLASSRALVEDPVVVVASHHHEDFVEGAGTLELSDRRRYGDNALYFYRRTG